MKNNTDTPKEELVAELDWVTEAVASYRKFLTQGNKKNDAQVKKETRKLQAVLRAIEVIKTFAPASLTRQP